MKARNHVMVYILFGLLLLCPFAARAQWDKKPPEEWSDKDAQKVLTGSPWSQTQTITEVVQPMSNNTRDSVSRDAPIGQSRMPDDIRVNFRIRFLSAKPVRLAFRRMIELQQKGEGNMEALNKFVNTEFPNHIVIGVTTDAPRQSPKASEARAVLTRANLGEIKNSTYLVTKDGHRVFLEAYQSLSADGMGARFIFPRKVDGKEFITPESGELRFHTELPQDIKLDQKFKIKDMMYQGKLEY